MHFFGHFLMNATSQPHGQGQLMLACGPAEKTGCLEEYSPKNSCSKCRKTYFYLQITMNSADF